VTGFSDDPRALFFPVLASESLFRRVWAQVSIVDLLQVAFIPFKDISC